MSTRRYKCLVPDCQNSIYSEEDLSSGWLCGEHFKLADYKVKKAFKKRKRRFLAGKSTKAFAIAKLWEVIKRQALERS